jgi:hypothetical protein
MDRRLLDVILISENQRICGELGDALERLSCRCWFASSAEEIRALLQRHAFRLVLSMRPVTEQSDLASLLKGPGRTIFYSVPVDGGCLWFRAFPEIVAGERLSAVRPGEFLRVLSDFIARSIALSVRRLKAATPLQPTSSRISPIPSSDCRSARILVSSPGRTDSVGSAERNRAAFVR